MVCEKGYIKPRSLRFRHITVCLFLTLAFSLWTFFHVFFHRRRFSSQILSFPTMFVSPVCPFFSTTQVQDVAPNNYLPHTKFENKNWIFVWEKELFWATYVDPMSEIISYKNTNSNPLYLKIGLPYQVWSMVSVLCISKLDPTQTKLNLTSLCYALFF